MNTKLVVFSRHGSHDMLRKANLTVPVLSCIRFGSITRGKLPYKVEINSPESIMVSANKQLMKEAFNKATVQTAKYWVSTIENPTNFIGINETETNISDLPYPIVAKHIFGSRGTGNYKLDNEEQLKNWMKGKNLSNYIFEEYLKGYNREYRLHVSVNGEFYSCRKLVKNETPSEKRWSRHDDNSVWILPENPKFDKPVNWDIIVEDCRKALEAVGADVLSFDVKVQTSKDKEGNMRKNPKFALLECNSASSIAAVGLEKYKAEIPLIINTKLSRL